MEVTRLLDAHREAGHGGGEPQEGLQAGERRAQQLYCIPPEYPQCHWVGSLGCNDQCRYPWTHDARVKSRVIGVDSGVSAATAASCCAILDPMGKRREPDICDDNPLTADFLEWMVSPDGQAAGEVSGLVFATLGNARVDARRRKIIWADGERLSIEQWQSDPCRASGQAPRADRNFPGQLVRAPRARTRFRTPDQRTRRLFGPWIRDRERKSRAAKK